MLHALCAAPRVVIKAKTGGIERNIEQKCSTGLRFRETAAGDYGERRWARAFLVFYRLVGQ